MGGLPGMRRKESRNKPAVRCQAATAGTSARAGQSPDSRQSSAGPVLCRPVPPRTEAPAPPSRPGKTHDVRSAGRRTVYQRRVESRAVAQAREDTVAPHSAPFYYQRGECAGRDNTEEYRIALRLLCRDKRPRPRPGRCFYVLQCGPVTRRSCAVIGRRRSGLDDSIADGIPNDAAGRMRSGWKGRRSGDAAGPGQPRRRGGKRGHIARRQDARRHHRRVTRRIRPGRSGRSTRSSGCRCSASRDGCRRRN